MRKGFGKTDTGAVRPNNEDALFVENGAVGRLPNAYAVADGMGGHNAGEVASRTALAFMADYARRYDGGFRYTQDLLTDAVRHANREVHRLSTDNATYSGMGTTLSVCAIDDENLYYAHVGDSRIYIITERGLKPVTSDHSLVAELVRQGEITPEEAREHPQRNIMTRALGTDAEVAVDAGYMPIEPNERVLLCSDGLTGMLEDAEIFALAVQDGDGAEAICSRLIRRANAKGGYDNITVIIVE